MPEHTIPEKLIERLRTGSAVIVAGAGALGLSWTQLLERMREALDTEDEAAAAEVAALVRAGNLARACGFLARALGEDACRRLIDAWTEVAEVPAAARSIARLPVWQVWTTLPGDALEQALAAERPEGWPEAEAVTYEQAALITPRRRLVVKALGDVGSYLLARGSAREARARAAELGARLRDLHGRGTLIFVGFGPDDPDLALILDALLGPVDLPAQPHYLIGAAVGPVAADELVREHGIEVLALPGAAAGGAPELGELAERLDALGAACARAGISLLHAQPGEDDLDGWLAQWKDDPEGARAALERMASAAREARSFERLLDILVAWVEREDHGPARAALLRQMAHTLEVELDNPAQAFTALTAALREDPADLGALDEAERLADAAGGWTELLSDATSVAGELADPPLAAGYWLRIGRWYVERFDHPDYGVHAYRQAIENDRGLTAAHAALAELLRKSQRWAELADVLGQHAEVEDDAARKIDLYLALGDLQETQLASTARAIDAYQAAAELDAHNDDALGALERLYRRDERWDKLAAVLEARARMLEASDPGRAAALRRELATLRAERLGDLEGAIKRYEAALVADAGDVEALRALLGLYERTGRTDDYLHTLERLIASVPEAERPTLLFRLAAEVEDRDLDRAVSCYEQVIATPGAGPAAHDAFRALERLFTERERWVDAALAYERHLEIADGDTRVALHRALAGVHERGLHDPQAAIAALARVREIDRTDRAALHGLARLYQRVDAWDRAVDVLAEHAALEQSAALYHEAGALITARLAEHAGESWAARAEELLENAMALEPEHPGAMRTLAALHRMRGNWANAIDLLRRTAAVTQNRLERIELLMQAGDVAELELDDGMRARELWAQVLEIDPERVDAGQRLSERLMADGHWDEAIPILEMLARKSEDGAERARHELALGRAHAALDEHDKAMQRYRRAVAADPDGVEPALALADALFASAGAEAEAEAWKEIDERYRDLVGRHRSALTDAQALASWYRLGVAARALGADAKAMSALAHALEIDPGHRPSLRARAEVAMGRQDWDAALAARRALLAGADADERAQLLVEIGGLLGDQLGDRAGALDAFTEGLAIQPTSFVLLHKVLDIYTAEHDWDRAVQVLDTLAGSDTAARRRSRYRFAAAMIARDELGDTALAAERLALVVDDAPDDEQAFTALVEILRAQADHRGLERAYRRRLARLTPGGAEELMLTLWTGLAELYAEHLRDVPSAITAMEVAAMIVPEDVSRREALVNLYLEGGEPYRAQAIKELHALLDAAPDRVELYRALSRLYREAGDTDKAFCLAQALVFLGAAGDEEKKLFARHRSEHLKVAERRITESLWRDAILHPREDRHVSAIFAAVIGAIASMTARRAQELGLSDRDRAEVGREARRVVGRVFKYVSDILALDPEPHLYVRDKDKGEGMRVLSTREGEALVPTVVVGQPYAGAKDDRALAFELGVRLSYFRPERYVCCVLDGPGALEAAWTGILAATGVREDAPAGEAGRMAEHLRKTVQPAVLAELAELARDVAARGDAMRAWHAAAQLSAGRVGLVLCNDLETAARLIATASGVATTTPKERLRDLVSYSVSEPYFAVRKQLGIAVDRAP